MQDFINNIIENLEIIVSSVHPCIGIIIGMLIIMLESMIPILPLALFIALNMLLFGTVIGFIMSWIATIIGCILSFIIVRKGLQNSVEKHDLKLMKKINKMEFTTFTMITALPFMPAFAINIAAGLSKMSFKRFVISIAISKLIIVYFWGFIGTSLIESITDVRILTKIIVMLLIAYAGSKYVMKKYKID